MKIWHISDTHGYLRIFDGVNENGKRQSLYSYPDTDCVIHSGDAANSRDITDNFVEATEFITFYSKFPQKIKIFVPGNHDKAFEHPTFGPILRDSCEKNGIHVLIHESVVIDGVKFFGSPYTPSFGKGWSYNIPRGNLKSVWDEIPLDTEVLITHGPPMQILDIVPNFSDRKPIHVGCGELYELIYGNTLKSLKLHCFGHIHDNADEGIINHGTRTLMAPYFLSKDKKDQIITFSNGAVCIGRQDRSFISFNPGNIITI